MDEPGLDDADASATEAATVAERPSAIRVPSGSEEGSAPTSTTGDRPTRAPTSTAASPADAARSEELARSRGLAVVGISGSLITAVGAPFFDVEPAQLALVSAGMACLFVSNVYLHAIARDATRYTEGRLTAVWIVATVGVMCAVAFFGSLSAASAAPVLGIYVAGRNASRRAAWATYLTAAVLHLATTIAGLVADVPALVTATAGPLETLLAELMVQLIFAGTHAAAAGSRRTLARILEELEAAVREVARREVQLDEAREDFARALPVGGAGRLTGERLGRFSLGVLLGRGGMGEVYEAVDDDGAAAAVKVLLGQAVSDDAVHRFLREARAAASLTSPHVVRVLDVGEPPATLPYLAMELLRGEDLSAHLRRLGATMAAREVVELVQQVGEGLEVAAAAGIVHRDVKPQNLYRVELEGGRVLWKILDFGVARLGASSGTLTRGRLLGTPSYMAPEQALAEDVGPAADRYGLAAVAYRCLVGRPPFRPGDAVRVIYRVVHHMPPRPSAHAPLHEDVDLALAIGLAKDPRARFASGAELADALAAALEGALDPALRAKATALLTAQGWAR